MFEFLFIIFIFNLSVCLYLFDIINIYIMIILPSILSKIILYYEKDFYLFFSKYKIIKKINHYDMELNKKCLFFIFSLFIKNIKKNNNNINSKIIIDDSEEE